MASPAHTAVSCAPPCIRRFSLQSNEQTDAAPASVDQALAVPGKPLQPELRQDMEQRFGYNFSRVRVHSGAIAEQSARDVSAQAYTVGPDLVFGAGRFAPGTTEGRRLIAHELTHVVQQSGAGQHTGPSTLNLHRFGESEHKKLGNLAKTKFPYFAKLATDEVALRSSPKGRRRDTEFHNLVASLREDVRLLVVGNVSKWMRVMAQSGTALDGTTNKPINAAGLTGYVSEELLVKEPGVFDQDLPVLPGLILTYGDFTALGGDHFDEFSKLEGKAKSPGGADKIKMFVDVVAGKRKGEFEDPNTIDKEWADRYKDLAFKNVSHFSHGGTALETWKRHHYDALMTAAKAGYFSNIDSLQRAYAINGFADHFLTDSFSSGHVRVPRMKILKFYEDFFNQNLDSILNYIYTSIGDQMMTQLFEDHPNVTGLGLMSEHDFCADNKEAVVEFKNQVEKEMKDNNLQPKDLRKLLVQYIGGAVSKVLHDDDNTSGLEVKSKKHPEGWKAFGDGKLNPSFQNYIVEAVEVSKTEVAQAFNIGIDFKKNTGDMKLEEKIKPLVYPASNVEDYIPETNTSKSTPLPEWKIDLTGWDTMDKSVQDKLTVPDQKVPRRQNAGGNDRQNPA